MNSLIDQWTEEGHFMKEKQPQAAKSENEDVCLAEPPPETDLVSDERGGPEGLRPELLDRVLDP
jgi:hypothetical protein